MLILPILELLNLEFLVNLGLESYSNLPKSESSLNFTFWKFLEHSGKEGKITWNQRFVNHNVEIQDFFCLQDITWKQIKYFQKYKNCNFCDFRATKKAKFDSFKALNLDFWLISIIKITKILQNLFSEPQKYQKSNFWNFWNP